MARRAAAYLGSIAASALLVLALPASAHAAPGAFLYTSDGTPNVLVNPQDNTCYSTQGGEAAYNGTTGSAELYTGSGCRGDQSTLGPGDNARDVAFGSVRFVS